VVTQA